MVFEPIAVTAGQLQNKIVDDAGNRCRAPDKGDVFGGSHQGQVGKLRQRTKRAVGNHEKRSI